MYSGQVDISYRLLRSTNPNLTGKELEFERTVDLTPEFIAEVRWKGVKQPADSTIFPVCETGSFESRIPRHNLAGSVGRFCVEVKEGGVSEILRGNTHSDELRR